LNFLLIFQMGCGSSRNTKAQIPIKKKGAVTLSFDPLTTLRIIQIGNIQGTIILTSGESENEQYPIISSRLYSTDKFLTIIFTNLKNFAVTETKIFPKIAYSLQEKKENGAMIANNDDYHSFSSIGTDFSNPETKIVLPLHDLNPKTLMMLNVSVKDTKVSSSPEIKAVFMFNIDANLKRDASKPSIPIALQNCKGSSLNGLNVASLTVMKDEEELKEPYIVEYGKGLFLRLNDMHGFKKNGEFVAPGCSLLSLNDEGEEVFFKENLFPDDNEYHEEDLTEFRVKIEVGGEKFKPLRDYWLNVRIWDNKGDGQLGVNIKYQGSNKVKEKVKVYEIKENHGEFTVKCKGESGFLKGTIVFIQIRKEISNFFLQNAEKTVELDLEFDEGFMGKKKDILEISKDGIERKPISWRLIAVTSPV